MNSSEFKQYIVQQLQNQANVVAPENIKNKAIEYIEQHDFPTQKTEEWKHTNIKQVFDYEHKQAKEIKIDAQTIYSFLIPDLDAINIVLINGYFIEDNNKSLLTQENIVIQSITDAKKSYSEIFNQNFNKSDFSTQNLFTALNTAYCNTGLFLQIKKNAIIDKPIVIINLSADSENDTSIFTRNLVLAESGCQAKIISLNFSIENSSYHTVNNCISEISVNENAKIEFYSLFAENEKSNHFDNLKIHQEKGSALTLNSFLLGGNIVRNEISVSLQGEQSECNLSGMYLPKNEQHHDVYTHIIHEKPHCSSSQVFKGIADNKATAVFLGKVFVAANAQKTAAFQSNKNILLTEESACYSKPQLEIYADDVKCSHGSSTGQIDKEQLFYLQSRGISKENAQMLLLHAFTAEIMDKISIPEFKIFIENIVENKFA